MKRFLAVLMLVVMMCGCVGLAEEQKFDYTVLEKLEGYAMTSLKKLGHTMALMQRNTLMRGL